MTDCGRGFCRVVGFMGTVLFAVAASWALAPMAEAQNPPLNDDVANATELTGISIGTSSSNVGATQQLGEPTCGAAFTKTVWYSWQSPITDTVRMSLAGSDFDTVLGVYTTADINNFADFTQVVCNDDILLGERTSSAADFDVVAGETYLIQIYGVDAFGDGTRGFGDFKLSIVVDPCTKIGEVNASPHTPLTQTECDALADFYTSTSIENGGWANSTGWDLIPIGSTTTNPCLPDEWHGLSCTATAMTIDLQENQLSGSIPDSIGNLTKLTRLQLFNNGVSGPIPDSIGNLTKLNILQLRANNLEGTIPPSLTTLTDLRSLDLGANQLLSGPIPDSIGNLTQLIHLTIDDSNLSGVIPNSVGNFEFLRTLRLGGNELTGPIPATIFNVKTLTRLELFGNQLSGPIPDGIGTLTELQILLLEDNAWSGSIPESFGDLSDLVWLGLGGNDLSGLVPPGLADLNISTLILTGNRCLTADEATTRFIISRGEGAALNMGCDAQPDTAMVTGGGVVVIELLANDGIPFSAIEVSDLTIPPSFGTLIPARNAVAYVQDGGTALIDSFTYEICSGTFCSSATVTVTIVAPLCYGSPAALWGGPGDDVLVGTPGDDVIVGFGGDDTITGGEGSDRLCGGDGNDTINGDGGLDKLVGGPGDDMINGGDDIDIVFAQDGNDTVNGGGGSDWIWGGNGIDTVFAGSGADRVFGEGGNDILNGQGGQDFMWGGPGNDTLRGSWQSDFLYGEAGDDILEGARGKDRLYGGPGDDIMYGGTNTDYLFGGTGNDSAFGQTGKDNPLVPDVSGCVAETKDSC